MNWQEVCEHPSLQDLPFKIELNEKGEIIMPSQAKGLVTGAASGPPSPGAPGGVRA